MIVMSTLRQMPLFFPRIHTAFHSYRWVAWLLACGATFWPTSDTLGTPRLVGLLVLTGVLNVAATAMAQSYVQLAQRRPWVLLFDILLGVSLIWISSSRMLPFLPYALGSLLLPAALASWRGSTPSSWCGCCCRSGLPICVLRWCCWPGSSARTLACRLGGQRPTMPSMLGAGRRGHHARR
jgi:hypothetical protein